MDSNQPIQAQEIPLTPDEQRIIHSRSFGALVPLFYTAGMRLWSLCILELLILLGPYWLSFLLSLTHANFLTELAVIFLWLLIYLTFLIYRILQVKQLAWKAGSWHSFERFLQIQKRWDTMGRLILLPYILVIIAIIISAKATSFHKSDQTSSPTPSPSPPSTSFNPASTSIDLGSGGYTRLAQMITVPDNLLLNGIQLGFTDTLPNSANFPGMSAEIRETSHPDNPDSGVWLGLNSVDLNANPTTHTLTGGSLEDPANPWKINLDVSSYTDPAESRYYFIVLNVDSAVDGTPTPSPTAKLSLTLKNASSSQILLLGSHSTETSSKGEDDWQVISGKSLDLSIQ